MIVAAKDRKWASKSSYLDLGRRPRRRRRQTSKQSKNRARRILLSEVDYIDNRCFRDRDSAEKILGDAAKRLSESATERVSAAPQGVPAHLARLCEAKLLTAEEERNLFQRMNFLKYRANSLRALVDPESPDESLLDDVEACLVEAREIRDQIVLANVRLVVSIAKKNVAAQRSFDELLSEGIEALIRVVGKFDYDRGFRFSTYAYRAIARRLARFGSDRQRQGERFISGITDTLPEPEEDSDPNSLDEMSWHRLQTHLSEILDQLDKRERLIIRARYGLGRRRKPRTCRAIGDRLGISKERVRQLERRAIAKLRDIAQRTQLDKLSG